MRLPEKKEYSKKAVQRILTKFSDSYKESMDSLFKKLKINSPERTHLKLATAKLNKVSSKRTEKSENKQDSVSRLFLETLTSIGHPAMTKEIAKRYKKMHPSSKSPKAKKALMQRLYNSASFLSKEGVINRKPVGKNSYEYSLKVA